MNTFEAKNLLVNSLRCLARSMEQIRLREIEKVAGDDEPMQDHLAQCTCALTPYEGSSMEDCCKYLQYLYKGFKEASDHEIKLERTFKMGDYDVAHLCDILKGFIGHNFPDDLVDCATEIAGVYRQALRALGHYIQSDEGCDQFVSDILPKAIEIIKKHDMMYWKEGEYSITVGYLISWLKNHYWNQY